MAAHLNLLFSAFFLATSYLGYLSHAFLLDSSCQPYEAGIRRAEDELFRSGGIIGTTLERLDTMASESVETREFVSALFPLEYTDELMPDDPLDRIKNTYKTVLNNQGMLKRTTLYCSEDHFKVVRPGEEGFDQATNGIPNIDPSKAQMVDEKLQLADEHPERLGEGETGLTDCQHADLQRDIEDSERDKVVLAYTYGHEDKWGMVLCPTTYDYSLEPEFRYTEAWTVAEYLMNNPDLAQTDLDTIKIISLILLHELTHHDMAMGDLTTYDYQYAFTGSSELVLPTVVKDQVDGRIPAFFNADSYSYLALGLMLDQYHWNEGEGVPVGETATDPNVERVARFRRMIVDTVQQN